MTFADVSLLLGAMGASFLFASAFGFLGGDSRADVALVAGAGALLTGAAGVLAVM